MKVDYIIVGQGICGTLLSWNLARHNQKVLVIDNAEPFSATRVASGIVNPVTGRRVVTTWMAEELLPFLWEEYHSLAAELGVPIIEQKNTIAFSPSFQMKETYEKRLQEPGSFIKHVEDTQKKKLSEHFNFIFNCYEIDPTYSINLHPLIHEWRKKLVSNDALLKENFELNALEVKDDIVIYKNINASKIIFCNGVNAFTNDYWKNLPYVYNKGQALIADIPELRRTNIYKFGALTLAPWYDNLWWIGSSYENEFSSVEPTDDFKKQTEASLKNILRIPFSIIDHFAAVRPATIERRPFVGLHPHYKSIGILNGMGTKGCSLAPWFAKQLTDHLLDGAEIDPLADIKRFHRILS